MKITTNISGYTFKEAQILTPLVKDNRIVIISCPNIKTSNIKRIELIPPLLVDLSNHTDKKIEWVHFGNYNFDINQSLKDALNQNKLIENKQISISFKGEANNSDIHDFYAKEPVSFFLSVSSSEGLPFSRMEASSYGIPIICTDVGGCNEITDNSLLLPANFTTKNFITIYNLFTENEFYYRNLAYKLWQDKFSHINSVNKFIALIK